MGNRTTGKPAIDAAAGPFDLHRIVSDRLVLFTILVTLNVLDVYLTLLGIRLGVLEELNPVMAAVIGDFWHAAAAKLSVLGVLGVALRSIRPRWTIMETVLASGVGWYTAVVAWNLSLVWPHVS